jgi:hypothetical protein
VRVRVGVRVRVRAMVRVRVKVRVRNRVRARVKVRASSVGGHQQHALAHVPRAGAADRSIHKSAVGPARLATWTWVAGRIHRVAGCTDT